VRTPFISVATLACMPHAAAKVLLELCSGGRHLVKGNAIDSSANLGMCVNTWRKAVTWLAEHGLIRYKPNARGWSVSIVYGRRFTWVPHYADGTAETCDTASLRRPAGHMPGPEQCHKERQDPL
jgi:hypothetical protein